MQLVTKSSPHKSEALKFSAFLLQTEGQTMLKAGYMYSADPNLVHAIRQFDYAGPIFTRDGRDQTVPLSPGRVSGVPSPSGAIRKSALQSNPPTDLYR